MLLSWPEKNKADSEDLFCWLLSVPKRDMVYFETTCCEYRKRNTNIPMTV